MSSTSHYGVPTEKMAPLELPPHEDACDTLNGLKAYVRTLNTPLAADLFCGAGGFSLGLDAAGFTTVVGVDHEQYPLETFRNLFPGMVLNRDLSDDAAIEEVAGILNAIDITALVGGPPCQPFSRAGRATIRKLVERGVRDAYDHRRDLWQSFLEIAALVQPPVVMMENVPDLALGDESIIMRLLVEGLEQLGYAVRIRLVDAWRYGVPQHRKRVLMVAMSEGRHFEWPEEATEPATVSAAIDDLPEVDGGWLNAGGPHGYLRYGKPRTVFQQRARLRIPEAEQDRIYDHVTRFVRDDDRAAFAQIAVGTSYADLDDDLKRYRDDIFDDKYNRLDPNDVSRTIIAHLAKDGYGFIHPTQDRTITIREAARLQTFGDQVRFAGPPTAAFRQIGNAVPPLLAEQLGSAALKEGAALERSGFTTGPLSESIASWYLTVGPTSQPWLGASSTWPIIVGELLLVRADQTRINAMWPVLESFPTPFSALEQQDKLRVVATWIDRTESAEILIDLASYFDENPLALTSLAGLITAPGLPQSQARLIALSSVDSDDDVLFTDRGVLRVVSRHGGTAVDRTNQRSDGRVETARLVGVGDSAREANLGLVEIARSVCLPASPRCPGCPLVGSCEYARTSGRAGQSLLFSES